MITHRKSTERGHADHDWLKSQHTFSFASYRDPQHMGFRALRVINEDRVAAGQGFGTHAHQDMEIVSYVLQGELEHKDSMGNGAVLRPGEFQRITAGTGITHSEFNPSTDQATHFYQIWLLPENRGLPPGYQQKQFDAKARADNWQLVASRNGTEDSLIIHQDAKIYLADLQAENSLTYNIPSDRHAWLQVLHGSLTINSNIVANTGDGLAVSDEEQLALRATTNAELMLFELA